MASSKVRFEVFKRDSFKCQYCGRTPPAVILELDHIIPRSQGGPDSMDNYITACFECNRGKGKNTLETAPEGVTEKLEVIREKRIQLREFNKYIERQERELTASIIEVIKTFSLSFPESQPTERFSNVTIKRFVSLLPLAKVKEAMMLACSTKPDDGENALRYFCGICWNWIKKPETRNW